MKFDAAIVPCETYDAAQCREALLQVLAPFGSLDWVKPGMKIVVKANLVSAMAPETAATTHPQLLAALCALLLERGAHVTLGDSPGGLYTPAHLKAVYRACGLTALQDVTLNENCAVTEAVFPTGDVLKTFSYTSYLEEADAIINFCKLKSHGMMALSAACKNLFGVIPGTMKPEYHFRFPEPERFSRMLLDLNRYFAPRICIVDAVEAMEGNGPTAGTPRHVGALLAGENSSAVDLLCAALIGLSPEQVPTLASAVRQGLIPGDWQSLLVSGDPTPFFVPDFQLVQTTRSLQFRNLLPGAAGLFLGNAAKRFLSARPDVDPASCVACGKCRSICPAKAITMVRGLPHIERSRCIRCFCCQEFCPKGAMRVSRGPIARLLTRSGTEKNT